MDGFAHAGQRVFDTGAAARLDLAVAIGDRAAPALAAWARWEREEGTLPSRRRAGPARRRLGVWLVRLGARLQGSSADGMRLRTRSSEAAAR
jgi:hypothetical protein